MALSTRLACCLLVVAAAMLLVAAAALASMAHLNQRLTDSLHEYSRLRAAYEVGLELARARESIAADADPRQRLTAVALRLRQLAGQPDMAAWSAQVERRIAIADDADPHAARASALRGLNAGLGAVAELAQEVRLRINAIEAQAVRDRRYALAITAGVSGVTLVLLLVMGVAQYRAILRPLSSLRRTARALADDQWGSRAPLVGDRELRELVHDFNRMADQLESVYRGLEDQVRTRSRQLVQSERLASVGVLAAGIAHEINNPLAIIAGQAELAQQHDAGRQPPAVRDALRFILDETMRCKTITGKLLVLSRPQPAQRRRTDLLALLEQVVDATTGLAHRRRCELSLRPPPATPLAIDADPTEIRQVFVNLILNGLAAVPDGGGRIELAAAALDGHAVVEVRDNGAGMDAPTLDRAFEPFFSKAGPANEPGSGLGLSVSHAIVQQHGGTLSAASAGVGLGCCFTVRLPLAAVRLDRPPSPAPLVINDP